MLLCNMGEYRLLQVHEDEPSRRWFYHNGGERVKFQRKKDTKLLLAVIYGSLDIYKLPRLHNFHYEFMQANRGKLSRGEGSADDQLILDNMKEHEETI